MPEFNGFPAESVALLAQLAENNHRDWFRAHRAELKDSLESPARAFVEGVEIRLGEGFQGKIFRFPRDLRFSAVKTPYNTHLRISFTAPRRAGYYFSLEPGQLVLGAGVFELDRGQLERFRRRVAGPAGAALRQALQGWRVDPPELKRVPAGWPTDHPHSDLLRRKSLTAWQDGPIAPEIHQRQAIDYCLAVFNRLRGVAEWLDDSLSEEA